MLCYRTMKSAETFTERVARQLDALMKRHNVDPPELARRTEQQGSRVDPVTIRRILKAEARTEPKVHTLRKLAEALRETYSQAFPEPEERDVVVEVGGTKYALKRLDGNPISDEEAAALRDQVTVERAQQVHKAKPKARRPRSRR